MSTTKHWELLPNTDFRNRMSWRELGNNRFAALRVRLLIVMREDSESKYGSVVNAYHIAAGADSIKVRRRREQVISRTTTISEAIRFTATSRVCDSLATKVSSELSAKAAGFSGKLGSEILAKSEYELTKTAENILTTTTSHSIQQTTEEEQEITMAAGTVARDVKLRRRYWPRRWAVYLHSYDYLELSFKKKWFWWQVRETIKQTESGILGWPLLSVLFYEPQSDLDVVDIPVADELDNPDGIVLEIPSVAMPGSSAPEAKSLEDLAKIAFPVSKQERKMAERERDIVAKKGIRRPVIHGREISDEFKRNKGIARWRDAKRKLAQGGKKSSRLRKAKKSSGKFSSLRKRGFTPKRARRKNKKH